MINKFLDWCCSNRKVVLAALMLVTVAMGFFATRVQTELWRFEYRQRYG